MNVNWSQNIITKSVSITSIELSMNFTNNRLFIRSFKASSFITCDNAKTHKLSINVARMNMLPLRISTFPVRSNINILMSFTIPPRLFEFSKYLDIVSHFNLIETFKFPIRQRRIETYKTSFKNTNTCCADNKITSKNSWCSVRHINSINLNLVMEIIDLCYSMIKENTFLILLLNLVSVLLPLLAKILINS